MKRITIIIIVIFTAILSITIINQIINAYFIKKDNYYNDIKRTHTKKYYYLNDFDSTAREALVIEKLEFKDSLINYYKNVAKGLNPIINFESYPIPVDTLVYVIDYEKEDTNIAKILFHYRVEFCNEENKIAYVYSMLLHDEKHKIQK